MFQMDMYIAKTVFVQTMESPRLHLAVQALPLRTGIPKWAIGYSVSVCRMYVLWRDYTCTIGATFPVARSA